ncbi:MAG: porin [Sandaracinaceae bacterium]|nr:porin [Sandaracinaceae bacterium]
MSAIVLLPPRAARADDALAEGGEPPPAEVETTEPSRGPPSGDPPALEARLAELEARLARFEVAAAQEERRAADDAQGAGDGGEPPARFTLGGWVEAYWGWNFNEPRNRVTDLRGFDNQHDSFNLSNLALDARWDVEGVNGHVTLQWGSTPATYYLGETAGPTLGTGIGAQSASMWQFVQQANVGYRVPIGNGLNVLAGLFLSPVGVEGMNVKDNWLYSRSNLFFGFPFYHTGLRVSYPIIDELTVVAWVINGWNTVLDNNDEKTVCLQASWSTDLVSGSLLYMTGVERPDGAPEGRAWRHTIDLNSTFTLTPWLALQGQVTTMIEPNAFGTSGAVAGALAARVTPISWLAFSARGDFFWESVASSAAGSASAIFWPVEWVSSFTLGADLRPIDHVSFRVEYRHDQASGPAYFAGTVVGNGVEFPFVRNATSQDTLTVGVTGWF